VVVDAIGPERSLRSHNRLAQTPQRSPTIFRNLNYSPSGSVYAHLIPITPWESLIPDIHERILRPLLNRRFVGLMLPMLAPQPPGIHAGDKEGRDADVDG
jgi:hypothetical protein